MEDNTKDKVEVYQEFNAQIRHVIKEEDKRTKLFICMKFEESLTLMYKGQIYKYLDLEPDIECYKEVTQVLSTDTRFAVNNGGLSEKALSYLKTYEGKKITIKARITEVSEDMQTAFMTVGFNLGIGYQGVPEFFEKSSCYSDRLIEVSWNIALERVN
ncbi:MAG: hypothetical protein ACRDDX_12875 [Cellulosilyticaceae bacterium]